MIELKSENEVSKPTAENNSFDPDKRIDLNQNIDIQNDIGFDPDKRLNIDETSLLSERINDNVDNNDNQKYNDIDDNPAHRNCPIVDGRWIDKDGSEGERGESKWMPDRDYVPQKSNPDKLSWGEILDSYEIDGIEFEDGSPQFDKLIKEEVEIENFTEDRSDNFDQADQKVAEKLGVDADDVAAWRKENKYTWHECRDMKTMQLVPSIVHNNVSHRGGVSEAKGV